MDTVSIHEVLESEKNGTPGLIPVNFQHGLFPAGRVYCKDSLNIGSLRKEIRHTLYNGVMRWYWIKDCHLTLLLQKLKICDV